MLLSREPSLYEKPLSGIVSYRLAGTVSGASVLRRMRKAFIWLSGGPFLQKTDEVLYCLEWLCWNCPVRLVRKIEGRMNSTFNANAKIRKVFLPEFWRVSEGMYIKSELREWGTKPKTYLITSMNCWISVVNSNHSLHWHTTLINHKIMPQKFEWIAFTKYHLQVKLRFFVREKILVSTVQSNLYLEDGHGKNANQHSFTHPSKLQRFNVQPWPPYHKYFFSSQPNIHEDHVVFITQGRFEGMVSSWRPGYRFDV